METYAHIFAKRAVKGVKLYQLLITSGPDLSTAATIFEVSSESKAELKLEAKRQGAKPWNY